MANIVICCDGTWNTPDQLDKGVPAPTNVVRLYNALAETDERGERQKTYYHPGVGTSGGWWDKTLSGGTGAGLDQYIKSAYQKLCYSYVAGDDIYLFGFSRGAYTVRSLCGFIDCCGLLTVTGLEPREVWSRIELLLKLGYRRKLETRADWDLKGWQFHNLPDEDIPIRFVGAWDTVGALGIPDDMALLHLLDDQSRYTFHDTTLHSAVQTARHALAMDERRASFQPTLWNDESSTRDLKQLWFPGVHADVGGGYRENGLADGALQWMIEEASHCGLRFNKAVTQIKPDYHDMMHDSCEGIFGVLPTLPRSVSHMASHPERFHWSALRRQEDPPISQSPYRRARLVAPPLPLELDVSSRVAWNETGLWLQAGVTYSFTASGEWLDGSIPCGPAGNTDGDFHPAELMRMLGSAWGRVETWYGRLVNNPEINFYLTKRHEQYPWFCLMGAIANGDGVDRIKPETFAIGDGCSHTPLRSGYFYAYANDAWNCYTNNQGHVALRIVEL